MGRESHARQHCRAEPVRAAAWLRYTLIVLAHGHHAQNSVSVRRIGPGRRLSRRVGTVPRVLTPHRAVLEKQSVPGMLIVLARLCHAQPHVRQPKIACGCKLQQIVVVVLHALTPRAASLVRTTALLTSTAMAPFSLAPPNANQRPIVFGLKLPPRVAEVLHVLLLCRASLAKVAVLWTLTAMASSSPAQSTVRQQAPGRG